MSNSSDSELESDEEELLVHVEFEGCGSNVFKDPNLKIDILGIDSDHPVMQVNGKFFEGTYEDAVGTHLYFEKDDNPVVDDPVFDKIPSLKYYAKTRKVLKMQRAFVAPNLEMVGDSDHNKCIPNVETLKEAGVPPAYQKDALSFWKNCHDTRIKEIEKYLQKCRAREELRCKGIEPESESDEENPFAVYRFLDNEVNASKNYDEHESS